MARSLIFIHMYIGMFFLIVGIRRDSKGMQRMKARGYPTWMAYPLTLAFIAGSALWPLIIFFFIREYRAGKA